MSLVNLRARIAGFAVVLTFIALSVSSCGSQESSDSTEDSAPVQQTAFVKYTDAVQDFAAQSLSMDVNAQTAMEFSGQSINQDMTGKVSISYGDGASDFAMHMSMNSESQSEYIPNTSFEGWYKDGYLYQNTKLGEAETKSKVQVSKEAALQKGSISAPPTLTEDDITDTVEEAVENGTKITFKVKSEALKQAVLGELQKDGSELGTDLSSQFDALEFTDTSVEAVVGNDGKLVSYGIKIGFAMKYLEQSMNLVINSQFNNIDYNAPEVTIPEDVYSYDEVASIDGSSDSAPDSDSSQSV